ncbi:MAG: class II aldolase/adducin family protein [Betaproteobacteria bacterium]|nr:class II aldolase/adducin family protein [Betaproteobacteria bacterium]
MAAKRKYVRSDELRAAIADLVDANHIIADQGVVDGFGHVSMRHPTNPLRYLLSKNVAPEQVSAADIMEFDLDSVPIDARGRSPYLERFIHGAIYKARPDVNSVINAHSPWVLSFAANKIPLRPMHNKAAFLAGGTPIFDIRDHFGATNMLVTTPEQAEALARALGGSAVLLYRGHGHVAVGPSLRVAVFRAYYAEFNARLQARSMALGGPITFVEGEEAVLADETMQRVDTRPWDLWKAKVKAKSKGTSSGRARR